MGNGIRPTNAYFTTFMKSISKSFDLLALVQKKPSRTEEAIACITNLKSTPSSGIDVISAKSFKLAIGTTAPILTMLFSKSMECS